jgi:hypothetical protein
MGSNNYGEIIRDEKRIEELERGIGFDWTLGYANKSGYLVQSRPITYPHIPDAQDIEEGSTTTVIDAGALSKMLMESDAHQWIDWGNGMVGLGIDVGEVQHYVLPMPSYWKPPRKPKVLTNYDSNYQVGLDDGTYCLIKVHPQFDPKILVELTPPDMARIVGALMLKSVIQQHLDDKSGDARLDEVAKKPQTFTDYVEPKSGDARLDEVEDL